MAEIRPFRGLCFDTKQVDLNRVTCPPYDIISPEERLELLARDPFNAVRLILGDGDAWHPQAAETLKEWRQKALLRVESEPVIYMYQHRFMLEGEEKTRRGFIALLRLAERSAKEVLPHEHTFEGPKADRFKLMQACEANLSPIFLLAGDSQGTIRKILAEASSRITDQVTDAKDVRHSVARIQDPEKIRAIQEALRGQQIFVADGHHRYETAQNYRDWRRQQAPHDPPDAPYHFQMVYICPMEDEGLHILPTHRVVGGISQDKVKVLNKELAKYFNIEPALHRSPEEFVKGLRNAGRTGQVVGLYQADGAYAFLTPRSGMVEKYVGDSTRTLTWRNLDVSVLHELALHRVLEIPRDKLLEHVQYVREVADAVRLVNQGKKQMAFLLNGTRIDQVRRICLEGEHMPQKSTDFYPKLLTGLVFYSFQG